MRKTLLLKNFLTRIFLHEMHFRQKRAALFDARARSALVTYRGTSSPRELFVAGSLTIQLPTA